jgi:hypothetical protein
MQPYHMTSISYFTEIVLAFFSYDAAVKSVYMYISIHLSRFPVAEIKGEVTKIGIYN